MTRPSHFPYEKLRRPASETQGHDAHLVLRVGAASSRAWDVVVGAALSANRNRGQLYLGYLKCSTQHR